MPDAMAKLRAAAEGRANAEAEIKNLRACLEQLKEALRIEGIEPNGPLGVWSRALGGAVASCVEMAWAGRLRRAEVGSGQAARSTVPAAASGSARVSQPSTLRMVISGRTLAWFGRARRHQRPEQHGRCLGRGQHGLRLDAAFERLVAALDRIGGPR